MSEKTSVTISFPNNSSSKAGILADELQRELRREVQDKDGPIETEIRRLDPEAQDLGSSIVMVLGAPAVVLLAKAILEWARRKDQASIDINGVVVRNVGSADVADIINAINNNRNVNA